MRFLLNLFPDFSDDLHKGKKLPFWKKLYLLFLVPFCIFLCGLRLILCPTTAKQVAKKIDGLKLPDGRIIKVTKFDEAKGNVINGAVYFTTRAHGECTFGIDPFSSVKTNVEDILQMVKEIDNISRAVSIPDAPWNRVEDNPL